MWNSVIWTHRHGIGNYKSTPEIVTCHGNETLVLETALCQLVTVSPRGPAGEGWLLFRAAQISPQLSVPSAVCNVGRSAAPCPEPHTVLILSWAQSSGHAAMQSQVKQSLAFLEIQFVPSMCVSLGADVTRLLRFNDINWTESAAIATGSQWPLCQWPLWNKWLSDGVAANRVVWIYSAFFFGLKGQDNCECHGRPSSCGFPAAV